MVLDCPELPPAPRHWCQVCQQQLQLTEPCLLLHKQGAWSSCTSTGSPSVCCKLAGSRDAATNTEGAVSEHHWEPSCQRDWNKINVMMLPCFPVQKQKGNRFPRSPVTYLYFNSTEWFPLGYWGALLQQHRTVYRIPESWILIQLLNAIDINLVICKKVGWNFCCCCLIHLPLEICSLHSKSGVRFIIWHKGNCQDFFFY